MAVTQLYNRTTNLNGLIEYVMNGDKTDEMKYVSGVNCLPETAYEEMMSTKNRFNKGKEKIIGYHLIQSFAEGEVTPEVAHELGLEYVNEVFGKDFEVVVATHLNTDNVHNHIVINSVSLKTGKKFYDYHASRDYLRIVSDCICQYYGLSVLEDKIWKHKGAYKRFAKENPYMQMVKSDVDRCLAEALYEKDFRKRLERLGYSYSNTYEQGLVIIDNTRNRKVYLQKFFGDEYSYNKVIDRILDYENRNIIKYGKKYKISIEEYKKMLEIKRKNEIKKLPLLYILFCLLLKIDPLPAKMDFGKARVKITKEMRIEIKYMNELSRQAVLLNKNKIGSLDDLNAFRTKLEDEVRTLKGTRESLQRKKRKSKNQEDIAKFDIELKLIAPKIKQLNADIQNCYKIEKRTILWQKDYDKAMEKEQEQQKQNELKQNKKKSRKYLK
ncbi:MAG: relaxase/mobilization nuclease domain-containing protein [Clostridia bacterium]